MANLKFKGSEIHTVGNLPKVGQKLTFENMVKGDLQVVNLEAFSTKRKVLNIFPSIDTGVCATSVREFNKMASDLENTIVLNISMDLPFAQSRFCGAEGIKNCESLSGFRSNFGQQFGVTLMDSPLAGLYARAVVVLDQNNTVLHAELVDDIVNEPNYSLASKALKS